jgi:hypothetical protein
VHESDHDRHLVAGAGDPDEPPTSTELDDHGASGDHDDRQDRLRGVGDPPPSPDLVQAVADFLDDLVDATTGNGPDGAPGQSDAGTGGGGREHGGSPDVDARGGLGIDITTITGARGGLGTGGPVGSVADPGHPHGDHRDECAIACRCGSGAGARTHEREVFGEDS